jgi:integrase
MFVAVPPQLHMYQDKIKSRLAAAFRESTSNAQATAFKTVAMFCILFSLPFPQVSVATLLAFIEFMADNKYNVATVRNYISACKTKFKQLQLCIVPFQSELIKYSFRSLEINAPNQYKIKLVLIFKQVHDLIEVMSSHPLYLLYKMAILLGFIGMLRISNVALVSLKQFQSNKHLERGDLHLCEEGIRVHLKWSKTMQTYRQGAAVVLPFIKNSNICPVSTLLALNSKFQIHPNQPLLAFTQNHSIKLQNMLNLAAKKLQFQHNITFHSLRRSAASLAFQSGVPLEQIKAIWSYIDSSAKTVIFPRFFAHQNYSASTPTALGVNLKTNKLLVNKK